jgi:hypothetical protein
MKNALLKGNRLDLKALLLRKKRYLTVRLRIKRAATQKHLT